MPKSATSPTPWWLAVRSGVSAALLGAVVAVCVAVLCWLPDASISGRTQSAVRAGVLAFLAAQHGGARINGIHAAFLPLGMQLVVAVIAWRSGSALAETAQVSGEPGTAVLLRLSLVQTASYAATCVLLAPFAHLGSSGVHPATVGVAAFLTFGIFGGYGFAAHCRLGPELLDRLPRVVRDVIRPAAAAVCTYFAAGAIVTAGSVVFHAGRVMELSRQVGGGLSGVPVFVLGLLSVPNAVVSGSAYVAGPGFAVGAGTVVAPLEASRGLVPAFPLLGALPGHPASPPVLGFLVAAQLVAGVLTGWLSWRAAGGRARRAAVTALRAALTAGALLGVAAWQTGGAVGAGRLRVVGASPWRLGVVVSVEVAVVALAVVAGRYLWLRWAVGRAADADEPELVLAGR
jgi:Family of unknown function (DUF6350)